MCGIPVRGISLLLLLALTTHCRCCGKTLRPTNYNLHTYVVPAPGAGLRHGGMRWGGTALLCSIQASFVVRFTIGEIGLREIKNSATHSVRHGSRGCHSQTVRSDGLHDAFLVYTVGRVFLRDQGRRDIHDHRLRQMIAKTLARQQMQIWLATCNWDKRQHLFC